MPKKPIHLAALAALVLIGVALAPEPAVSQPQPIAATSSESLCPPLPAPSGPTVTVSTVAELQQAVLNAAAGDTILVADGAYHLNGVYLRFDTPNVTLRSASGNREAVILDGNYVTTEIVQVVASGITIAELTLREAYYHPIHVMSSDSGDTTNTLIYDVHIIDPGEQAIKINPGAEGYYPDDGIIACSHIELTDAGRPYIRNNCYTGGIDAHQARGWTVRDNIIEGFWCASGLSEHGIHFWRACRDTVVERNVLRENARGIGFGLATTGDARIYPDNPCPGADGGYVDHYDGIIRNNFVFASQSELFASEYGFDCGICLWQACGAQAVHNTVASTQAPFSSIEWRFDHTDVEITNNLVTHNLLDRGGVATLAGNLEYAPLSLFVDGTGGDLHLTAGASAAIDQGESLSEGLGDDDIDGDARPIGAAPDVGADEYGIPSPAAVTDLRVSRAYTDATTLTVTLGWTAPSEAVTATLRFSGSPISEANWSLAAPLTDTLPGSAGAYTATVAYGGGTVYFAHKSHNAGGWSALSNNAFWPHQDIYLPLVLKESVP
ncbi:MAG: hypothetical protein ACOYZ7_01255 [Chloroflexota bacterium]